MIELTSLSGSSFVLNSNLIETIETIPETKVTLTNGKYFLVGEEKEEIIQRIIDYNRQVFLDTVKLTEKISENSGDFSDEVHNRTSILSDYEQLKNAYDDEGTM